MTHPDAPLQLQLLKKEYPVEHNGQIYFRWPFIPVSNLDFLMSQIMKYPHQLDCKVLWYFMFDLPGANVFQETRKRGSLLYDELLAEHIIQKHL